jgi:hypothetical protein
MSKHRNAAIDRDRLPFVAPCRKLSLWAPFRWIRLGVGDLIQAPQQSLVYGLVVAVLIGTVSLIAWFHGSQWIMFGMLGGFVFLAPLTCVGLYAISAQLERGQEPVLARSLRAAFKRHIGNEAVFALVLLVIFHRGHVPGGRHPDHGRTDQLPRFRQWRRRDLCRRYVLGERILIADAHASRRRQRYGNRHLS